MKKKSTRVSNRLIAIKESDEIPPASHERRCFEGDSCVLFTRSYIDSNQILVYLVRELPSQASSIANILYLQ